MGTVCRAQAYQHNQQIARQLQDKQSNTSIKNQAMCQQCSAGEHHLKQLGLASTLQATCRLSNIISRINN
eukprot:950177-Pelagomonas_calceolata.AAC.1